MLAAKDFASHQTLEQAQANRDQAAAGVQQRASRDRIGDRQCRRCSKASSRKRSTRSPSCKTALAKAERDLSFTVIRAPIDGVIGNRAMQVGDYLQTGAADREPRAAR